MSRSGQYFLVYIPISRPIAGQSARLQALLVAFTPRNMYKFSRETNHTQEFIERVRPQRRGMVSALVVIYTSYTREGSQSNKRTPKTHRA